MTPPDSVCEFPRCVEGEKPPYCGNCGDRPTREEAAPSVFQFLRVKRHTTPWRFVVLRRDPLRVRTYKRVRRWLWRRGAIRSKGVVEGCGACADGNPRVNVAPSGWPPLYAHFYGRTQVGCSQRESDDG